MLGEPTVDLTLEPLLLLQGMAQMVRFDPHPDVVGGAIATRRLITPRGGALGRLARHHRGQDVGADQMHDPHVTVLAQVLPEIVVAVAVKGWNAAGMPHAGIGVLMPPAVLADLGVVQLEAHRPGA